MTTPNPARAAKLSSALAKGFGETFTFTAKKYQADVDLPRVADATRTEFSGTGVWAGATRRRSPDARGSATNNAHAEVSSVPTVTMEAAALSWVPVEGDLCRRALDSTTYTVARTMPDGFGRIKIFLSGIRR